MVSKVRFFVPIIVLIAVLFGCGIFKSDKPKKEQEQKTTQPKDTVQINKDQYRVAEIFDGPKNQIIDLMDGPATFEVHYMGNSHFKAILSHPDGRMVALLAESDGPIKLKKRVDIPETKAYVLDVETTGQWSIYRE